MKYIDIHCHLDYYTKEERDGVLARMEEKEVGAITIGTDLNSSKKAIRIAEKNESVWATIGIHPEGGRGGFNEKIFDELVKFPKIVGIGECGLDYFGRRSLGEGGLSEDCKKAQKKLFESQIQFAIQHDKPLMLHIRNAYNDALAILKNYKKEAKEKLRGNVHFFAGGTEIAKKFLDLSFTMSFTGVITFTRDYDEVIKYIPLDSIMSETDAPFVAPIPYRGKKNEPAYVIEVVKKLAEIRKESPEALNDAIIKNFKRIFKISCM